MPFPLPTSIVSVDNGHILLAADGEVLLSADTDISNLDTYETVKCVATAVNYHGKLKQALEGLLLGSPKAEIEAGKLLNELEELK